MTLSERIELSDSLDAVRVHLENAMHLSNELSDRYFERYSPDDGRGNFSICNEFKRERTFARMLGLCLAQIESDLPSTEWIDALNTET